jgi:hypothetical protein
MTVAAEREGVASAGALPVIRMAIDARLPCDLASIRARPGDTPITEPSFLTRAIMVSELEKTNLAEGIRFPLESKAAAKSACF